MAYDRVHGKKTWIEALEVEVLPRYEDGTKRKKDKILKDLPCMIAPNDLDKREAANSYYLYLFLKTAKEQLGLTNTSNGWIKV